MSRKTRRKQSQCAKIGYDTADDAKLHVEALRAVHPFERYKVYPCKCGRYHVAHDNRKRRF